MSEIKLKIVLNKGRHGIVMYKLAKIAEEAEKFLVSFSNDLKLNTHDWIADSFQNGSVSFTANYIGEAKEPQVIRAKNALSILIDPKVKVSDLNGDLSRQTYAQFAKITHPIDADDSIGLAVPNDKGRFVTKILTKERAIIIEREMTQTTEEFAGFQGYITALFREGTCWLKDFVSNERIVCHYKPHHYDKIWKILEDREALADVEGWLITKPDETYLKIEHISSSAEYREGDIEKFFGSDPGFTGEKSTDEYLAELRDEKTD
jgi:hypothetical protein